MMSSTDQVDDDNQMVLISQYYPGIYTQFVPEQGEIVKPKRRRKKNKLGEGGNSGMMMMRKRKLSEEQVNLLEENFGHEHKLESERKDKLASELGLDPRQVAVWFQNRRARWKSKKLEEEYSRLKNLHESTVIDKCRLETEVLRLKEQVLEAEKEIQRLLRERSSVDRVSSNSPSSSALSMEAMDIVEPPLFLGGGFGMEEGFDNNVFYYYNYIMPTTASGSEENNNNSNNYIQGMDWPFPI